MKLISVSFSVEKCFLFVIGAVFGFTARGKFDVAYIINSKTILLLISRGLSNYVYRFVCMMGNMCWIFAAIFRVGTPFDK